MMFHYKGKTMKKLLMIAATVLSCLGVGAAQADTLADIKAAGTVKIGIFEDFPPFATIGKDMQLHGYDIDMANAIGKSLGVKVELVPITGQNRIAALDAKKVDILLSLGYSDERAKALTFSASYAPYYVAIFAPKTLAVTKPEDLAGKRVAVNRGTLDDTQITAAAPKEATIERFDNYAGVIQALKAKKVDAIFTGNDVGAQVMESDPAIEQKFVLLSSPSRLGVRKGETGLADALSALVKKMIDDGSLSAMCQTWLKRTLTPADLEDKG